MLLLLELTTFFLKAQFHVHQPNWFSKTHKNSRTLTIYFLWVNLHGINLNHFPLKLHPSTPLMPLHGVSHHLLLHNSFQINGVTLHRYFLLYYQGRHIFKLSFFFVVVEGYPFVFLSIVVALLIVFLNYCFVLLKHRYHPQKSGHLILITYLLQSGGPPLVKNSKIP